jgi:hypothetical protein
MDVIDPTLILPRTITPHLHISIDRLVFILVITTEPDRTDSRTCRLENRRKLWVRFVQLSFLVLLAGFILLAATAA